MIEILTIELNPHLHHVVYMMKNVELRNESPFLGGSTLSKEETLAVIKTLNPPAKSKSKRLSEPKCYWD